MTILAHDDPLLNYVGRWINYGTAMGSAWGGGQLKFKISGVLSFDITYDVLDLDLVEGLSAWILVDGGNVLNETVVTDTITTGIESYSGQKTITHNLPDIGEHTISLRLRNGGKATQFFRTIYADIMSIDIGVGVVTEWVKPINAKMVAFVGDSWMGPSQLEYHRFLDTARYWPYPISQGGANSQNLNDQINFQADGVPYSDPPIDLYVINSSVNDWVSGLSLAVFNTNFSSLIDNVRAQNGTAPIIIYQTPRNLDQIRNWDKYGPEMEAIAAARNNVFYYNSPVADWPLYDWWTDGHHLDVTANGVALLASKVTDMISPHTSSAYSSVLILE